MGQQLKSLGLPPSSLKEVLLDTRRPFGKLEASASVALVFSILGRSSPASRAEEPLAGSALRSPPPAAGPKPPPAEGGPGGARWRGPGGRGRGVLS